VQFGADLCEPGTNDERALFQIERVPREGKDFRAP
jgi:hypothetical protein